MEHPWVLVSDRPPSADLKFVDSRCYSHHCQMLETSWVLSPCEVCEHRWQGVAGLVRFRRLMGELARGEAAWKERKPLGYQTFGHFEVNICTVYIYIYNVPGPPRNGEGSIWYPSPLWGRGRSVYVYVYIYIYDQRKFRSSNFRLY